jgi:disintegrin and metalloproteinase domain-containing protein 10
VDPSGPLATLRRLLLSDESIASLKRWVEDHWYGVLFIAVGFISVVVSTVSALSLSSSFSLLINRHRYACCLTGEKNVQTLHVVCK